MSNDSLTAQVTLDAIEGALESVRPALLADGGDIELVRIEEKTVYVRLKGACVRCPVSFYTLSLGVQEAIVQHTGQAFQVVAVE